jgi:hypothetical protein
MNKKRAAIAALELFDAPADEVEKDRPPEEGYLCRHDARDHIPHEDPYEDPRHEVWIAAKVGLEDHRAEEEAEREGIRGGACLIACQIV